jgi:hypothetical protein
MVSVTELETFVKTMASFEYPSRKRLESDPEQSHSNGAGETDSSKNQQ